MKIIDNNSYLNMCSIIENSPDCEHAFLLRGQYQTKDNIILQEEPFELNDYIVSSDSSHIKFSYEFLIGGIRGFIKNNWIYVFAHSHVKQNTLDIVDFSEKDLNFENGLWDLACQEGYHNVMIFLVFHDNACKAHGFLEDGTRTDFKIDFSYQDSLYDYKNLHIFYNKKKGCIYNVAYN